MNSKKKITLISIALSATLILGACQLIQKKSENTDQSSDIAPSSISTSSEIPNTSSNNSSSSSSSSSSSQPSSSVEVTKFTVIFKSEGVTLQTSEVEEGTLAVFEGELPTKSNSAFKCWDPDINSPILRDTVFNAVFVEYANEMIIDDFSTYEDTSSMMDKGWVAIAYKNGTWSEETNATVSLSNKSEEHNKSLKYDAWANSNDYKFAKKFKGGEFNKSANAINFKLAVPTYMTVKVLLHAKLRIAGTEQTPYFSYPLTNRISNEFVDYTIPLNDPGWCLWGEEGKSISTAAEWLGVSEDAILAYLTRIEFYFKGNDGSNGKFSAYLDTAKFVTLNNPQYQVNELINTPKVLTGTTTSGYTLKVDVDVNNDSTATIIDMETPVSVTGKVRISGNNLSFVSNDNGASLSYNALITDNGKTVKYVSASGTYASEVEAMDMYAVQTVDDYEQYTEDGTAYYQGSGYEDRSGCRGNYYSEFYSNNDADESPWGGKKWKLMGGSGDQLKLKQDPSGAHSGNNYICMKNSKDYGMRYMQMGLFNGTSEENSFRGTKLGFWAKTNGIVKGITISMYAQSAPTNATRDEKVSKVKFTENAAISEWKHYEIDLNPKYTYYGYMFFLDANYTADSYLYVDDIEIYGASPYAVYEAPVPFTLTTGAMYTAKINDSIQAFLDVKSESAVTLRAPGLSMSLNGTYVIDEETSDVTISLDGGVTYVVTGSNDNDQLVFKSVNGTGLVAQALNNLSFDLVTHYDNAESYAGSGMMYYQGNTNENNRSGARGAYYCDYYAGSGSSPVGGTGWMLMGGSPGGDQLSLDTEVYYQGSKSIKLKRSSVTMRYMEWDLYKGTAKPITGMDRFSIVLKNQASDDTVVRILVFTEQMITSTNHTTARINMEVTLEANQDWTEYNVTLDPSKTYYGYGIILPNDSSVGYVNFDNAMFKGPSNDPSLNFYAKKDVTISGELSTGGATASLTFGNAGTAKLNCAALNANDLACTYTMKMVGNDQIMTITVSDSVITGKFTVDATGKVTFVVTEVTGSLAAAISIGASLTNN